MLFRAWPLPTEGKDRVLEALLGMANRLQSIQLCDALDVFIFSSTIEEGKMNMGA